MKQRNKNILWAVILCATLGLAPFSPEPHIVGKLRWLFGGADGMGFMDYFDLLLHSTPWVILLIMIYRKYWLKRA
ncbi:MAG TPA: hypothetical protein PKL31_15140 [Fulvivirga sp.]|nr:hypothetical protein [Fulvivirga sp.]